MITRREAIAGAAALAGATSLGVLTAEAGPASPAGFTPDRELHVRLSDTFRAQGWAYAGQGWCEQRDEIVLHEDERLRLIVTNDTDEKRVFAANEIGAFRVLGPGEAATFDLTLSEPMRTELFHYAWSPGQQRRDVKSRAVHVRASYGAHPLV